MTGCAHEAGPSARRACETTQGVRQRDRARVRSYARTPRPAASIRSAAPNKASWPSRSGSGRGVTITSSVISACDPCQFRNNLRRASDSRSVARAVPAAVPSADPRARNVVFSEWLRKASVASPDMPHRGSAALSSDRMVSMMAAVIIRRPRVPSEATPTRSSRLDMIRSGTTPATALNGTSLASRIARRPALWPATMSVAIWSPIITVSSLLVPRYCSACSIMNGCGLPTTIGIAVRHSRCHRCCQYADAGIVAVMHRREHVGIGGDDGRARQRRSNRSAQLGVSSVRNQNREPRPPHSSRSGGSRLASSASSSGCSPIAKTGVPRGQRC